MRKYWQSLLVSMLLVSCLTGCIIDQNTEQVLITEGYRPVYGAPTLKEVKLVDSQQLKDPGKIYSYKNYLLVGERNEGIHVFDNSDPKNPKAVGFIQIVGNSDMAIKNDVLYADHMGNLVAIDISDFSAVNKLGSLPLQNWDLGIPPPMGAYFECVDQSKGLVVRWTKVELKNPSCYAIN